MKKQDPIFETADGRKFFAKQMTLRQVRDFIGWLAAQPSIDLFETPPSDRAEVAMGQIDQNVEIMVRVCVDKKGQAPSKDDVLDGASPEDATRAIQVVLGIEEE